MHPSKCLRPPSRPAFAADLGSTVLRGGGVIVEETHAENTTSGKADPGSRDKSPVAAAPEGADSGARPGSSNDVVLREIGKRLRALRIQRGVSLREAARLADMSSSFLGMLERGSTAVAISRLISLADVYGVSVADLLANVGEPDTEFMAGPDALVAPTESDDVSISYLSSPSWSMQPFLVRLQPGAHLESLSHSAEEFVHCMSGSPTIVVSGREYPMAPGDTLFLRASAKHAYVNDTRGIAILLGAVRRSPDGGPTHPVPRR